MPSSTKKNHTEIQGTQNIQNHLEKEKQSWGTHTSFRTPNLELVIL